MGTAEFEYIEFRDSAAGRQAYVRGSSTAVWGVVMIARGYDMDAAQTAAHFRWPVHRVRGALNYAAAFPEEIEAALRDNEAWDFEALSRLLPKIEAITVPAETPAVGPAERCR